MSTTIDDSKLVGRCFRTTGDEFTCTAVAPRGPGDDALTLVDDDTMSVMRLHQSTDSPSGRVERELRVIARVNPDARIDFPLAARKIGEALLRNAGEARTTLDGYACRELAGLPIAYLPRSVLRDGSHRAAMALGFHAIVLALLGEGMVPVFATHSPVDLRAPERPEYAAFIRFVDNVLYDPATRRTSLASFSAVHDVARDVTLSDTERNAVAADAQEDFEEYLGYVADSPGPRGTKAGDDLGRMSM